MASPGAAVRGRRAPGSPQELLGGGVLVALVEPDPSYVSRDSSSVDMSGGKRSMLATIGTAAAWCGRVLGVLVVLASGVVIADLSSGGNIAYADICIDQPQDNSWDPDVVRSGMTGLIPQAPPKGNWSDKDDLLPSPENAAAGNTPVWTTPPEAMNDTAYTDYEKLGMGGAFWSVDYGSYDFNATPCFPLEKMIGSFLANRIFDFAKVIDRVSISTYQWATSSQVAAPLNEPLDQAVSAFYGSDPRPTSEDRAPDTGEFGIVRSLIVVAIAIGAIWIAWMAIARRRFSLGLGGVAWMVAALVALMLFVQKPSAIASTVDEVVADTTNSVMSASSGVISNQDDGRVSEIYGEIRDSPNGAGRISADMMWRVLVFQPWAAGQWGSSAGPVPLVYEPQGAGEFYNSEYDARYIQLYTQACTLSRPGTGEEPDRVPYACDGMASVVGDIFGVGAKYHAVDIPAVPAMYARWWWALENWTCTGQEHCLKAEAGDPASPGNQYRAIWAGDKAGDRIMASLTALVSAILLGGLIFLISAAIIAYDLMMYMLLFIGPFMLLIGIHPSFGRRLAIGWANVLVQNIFKRAFMGILLGVIVLIYAVIGNAALGWFQQLALMTAATVAVLLLRAPLLAAAGVVRVGEGSPAMEGADDRAVSTLQQRGRQVAEAIGSRTVSGTRSGSRRLVGGGIGYRRGREVAAREGLAGKEKRRVILSGALGGQAAAVRKDLATGRPGKLRTVSGEGAGQAAQGRVQRISDRRYAATAKQHGEQWQRGKAAIRDSEVGNEVNRVREAARQSERAGPDREVGSARGRRRATSVKNTPGPPDDPGSSGGKYRRTPPWKPDDSGGGGGRAPRPPSRPVHRND